MAADLFSELPLSIETEVLSKLTDKEVVSIINRQDQNKFWIGQKVANSWTGIRPVLV